MPFLLYRLLKGGTARVPEAMAALEEARPDDSNINIPPLQQPKYCYRSLQDAVPAWVVLYLLSFSGFLVLFMMRTDINIVIVAMVKLPPPLPQADTPEDDPLVCYTTMLSLTLSNTTCADAVPAWVVLYLLSFSGFLVSFMMRTDINIVIVAMVKLPPPLPQADTPGDDPLLCYTTMLSLTLSNTTCADAVPARVVLYLLPFSGFLVSFMMQTDINIVIVAMVKLPSPLPQADTPGDDPLVCYTTMLSLTLSNNTCADAVPAGVVLYLLSFSGFLVLFMMWTDINIAIVAMVELPPPLPQADTPGDDPLVCYTTVLSLTLSNTTCADAVPARVLLYLLSFSGFLVSFMMQTDINIAIIAMVELPPPLPQADTLGDDPLVCYTTVLSLTLGNTTCADAVPARVVLYLLSFSGFLVSFMMRTDINIAIVAMVKLPPPLPQADTPGDDPLVCYTTMLSLTLGNTTCADAVPARVVLYLLSFSGFLVSFMMRTDINIAIVAMVKLPPPLPQADTPGDDPLVCYDQHAFTNSSADDASVHSTEEGEFDWDATVQGAILSSFYWCYILSQVIGGMLTQKFGTKAVFGYSQLATAACSLLIPSAADIHYGVIILLRSIQGVASGLTWPAMYAIVGQWIPAIERSRFMSSFQGFSFGIGLTYPLAGFLIAHSGWRLVFYTTGTIGALWCIFWYLFAFDAPHKHPRITKQELEYIQSNIGSSVQGGQSMKVPWMSIMTSLPAWAIGITTFGRIWVHYTFIIPGPMYMKTVLGFSIQKNGVLSGLPFLLSYLSSVVFCYVADFLVTRNLISLTNVRKIFTAMSQVIPGLMLLAIGYLGCHITLVLVIWFIAVSLITASYAGAMASVVDIGPNLAGPILAFAQTIHMTASFLSPIVAGFILKHNNQKSNYVGGVTTMMTSLEQWRKVFWVAGCVACGTYVFFQIFGTSKVQPWNYPDGKIPDEDLEPLSKRKATRRDSADFATDG